VASGREGESKGEDDEDGDDARLLRAQERGAQAAEQGILSLHAGNVAPIGTRRQKPFFRA
jgi:hypothetical protein